MKNKKSFKSETIGYRIRTRRRALKITMEELAKNTGISLPTIHRYETGRINNYKFDYINKIATVLNIDAAELLDETDETSKENSYRDIINEFGTERQCRQAMEECAELIQAINKALRFPDDPKRLVQLMEELADVKIMILQLEEIFNISWKDSVRMFQFKRQKLQEKYIDKIGMNEEKAVNT